ITISLLFSRYTPDDLCNKKIMLLGQLAGCFSSSLFYSLLQPFPLYPHKVFMFSGPFRSFGSETAAILFVVWCGNLTFLSCAAITTSFNHYIETMEQFKQKNILFEFFRNLSVFRRMVLYGIFHGVIIIIAMASLVFSIDYDASLGGGIFDFLRNNNALINFKSKYGTLEVKHTFFLNSIQCFADSWGNSHVLHIFIRIYCIFLEEKCMD
ncbi:hypothetical protein PMAYCL1PPCAC_20991, partial [Pristionchus mayeri]